MLFENDFYSELKRKLIELTYKMTDKRENKLSILCMDVNKKFGFPTGMVSDVVTFRVDMQDTLEVLLYAIAFSLNNNNIFETKINLERYFPKKEIAEFSKYKYQVSTIKFPFTFASPMIEIKPDEQYIGRTTVKELMQLRDAQIINYNANTQRTMTLKKGKDFEYYKITLNHKAVDQIVELLKKGDFVPNTLTFNLSPETDFTYKNGKLTINEKTAFDILDGYHRYIAMSNLYNIDKDFDYPMEIRIMFLSEENAKQFIYQEDQRTPLAKDDAKAMNKNDVGVKICRFLKNKLSDIISQQGIINEPLLVKLIDLLYVKGGVSYERSKLVSIANEIADIINGVSDEVPEVLDSKWSNKFTIIFFGLASKGKLKGKALINETERISQLTTKEEKIEQLTLKRLNTLLGM